MTHISSELWNHEYLEVLSTFSSIVQTNWNFLAKNRSVIFKIADFIQKIASKISRISKDIHIRTTFRRKTFQQKCSRIVISRPKLRIIEPLFIHFWLQLFELGYETFLIHSKAIILLKNTKTTHTAITLMIFPLLEQQSKANPTEFI